MSPMDLKTRRRVRPMSVVCVVVTFAAACVAAFIDATMYVHAVALIVVGFGFGAFAVLEANE